MSSDPGSTRVRAEIGSRTPTASLTPSDYSARRTGTPVHGVAVYKSCLIRRGCPAAITQPPSKHTPPIQPPSLFPLFTSPDPAPIHSPLTHPVYSVQHLHLSTPLIASLTIPSASAMTSSPLLHVYNFTPCASSNSCARDSRRSHRSTFLLTVAAVGGPFGGVAVSAKLVV